MNNIDQELNRKANDTDLRLVLDEVTLKPSTKDVEKLMKTVLDRYDGLVDEVKQSIGDEAEQNVVTALSDKVRGYDTTSADYKTLVDGLKREIETIRKSKACNDYPLSIPPKAEEIAEINKMALGSFYTINGGNVTMVFRQPFELPNVEQHPADAPVAVAPVADAPVADAPVADAPVADAPVADAPDAEGVNRSNNQKIRIDSGNYFLPLRYIYIYIYI